MATGCSLPGFREATVRALLSCATATVSPGGCRRQRRRPWWHWLSRPSSRRRRPRRTPSPTSRPRSPVRALVRADMLRNLLCMRSVGVADEESVSRGRRETGADQAPQVGQGAAVHDQVRRHLHPRRRRRARGGPAQRQEVNQPPNLHRRTVTAGAYVSLDLVHVVVHVGFLCCAAQAPRGVQGRLPQPAVLVGTCSSLFFHKQ